jgi:hypothetical protein
MDSRFEFLDLDALLSKSFSELTEVELAFLKSEGIGENMFHQMQGVHSEASLETEVPTVPGYISTALMEQFAEQNHVAGASSSQEKESGKKKIAWLYWSGAAAIAAVLVLGVLNIDFSNGNDADLALNDTQKTTIKKEESETKKSIEEGKGEKLLDTEDAKLSGEANLVKELNEQGANDKSLELEKDVTLKDRKDLAANRSSVGTGVNSGLTDDLSDYADDYPDATATGATSTIAGFNFNGTSDIHDDAAGMNERLSTEEDEIAAQPLSAVGNMYSLDAVRTASVPGVSSREAKKGDSKDLLGSEQDPMLDILHTAW